MFYAWHVRSDAHSLPAAAALCLIERWPWRQCYGCKVTDVQNTIDLANSWGAANVFTEGACDPTDPACTGVDREVTIAASAAGISWTHYQCEQRLRSLQPNALP